MHHGPSRPPDSEEPRPSDAEVGLPALDPGLTESLYAELRAAAARCMRGERRDHLLDPTAVVHEAWLRLHAAGGAFGDTGPGRMALGALLLRRVLVDHARARDAHKRGGRQRAEAFPSWMAAPDGPPVEILDLDEALERLAVKSPRQARVVELRFFGGLGVAETGEALGISSDTVKRDWRFARAWLTRELSPGRPAGENGVSAPEADR